MDDYRARFDVPPGAKSVLCRGPHCQAPIFWVRNQRGRRLPINLDGTLHSSTCPDSDIFRKVQALDDRAFHELLELAMRNVLTFKRLDQSFLQSSWLRVRLGEKVMDWEKIRVQRIIRSNPQMKDAS